MPARRALAAAAVLTALGLTGAVSACGGPQAPPTPIGSPAAVVYTFRDLFPVKAYGSQQGLGYAGGVHYVAYDVGKGMGRIAEYGPSGRLLGVTKPLPLGHSAEIGVRQRDGNLYVATGGPTQPTYVNVVNLQKQTVVRRYDLRALGPNGMVAFDNVHDRMVVFAGKSSGPYVIAFVSLNGRVRSKVTIPNEGTPQGIEVLRGRILLYTSIRVSATVHSRITVFDLAGHLVRYIPVDLPGEAEGLSVDEGSGRVYVGVNKPNRLAVMSPAFAP